MEWQCFLWGGKLTFNVIFMNMNCLRAGYEGEKEIRELLECWRAGISITQHYAVDRSVSVPSVFLARQILQLAGNARCGAMTSLPSPHFRSAGV
jgi:hypothetical protein